MSKVRAEFYNNLIDRILDSKLEAETRLEEELVEKIFFAINTVVEKQVAKKLVVWDNGTQHCPNCEHDLTYISSEDEYCCRCGQRLESE